MRSRRGRYGSRNKNGTGSVIVTLMIYGLFAYLLIGMFHISLNKLIPQDFLAYVVKDAAKTGIGRVGYIAESDKKILSGSKYDTASVILRIVSGPVSEYSDNKEAVNVADEESVIFFLDNTRTDEDTNEMPENGGSESTDRETEVLSQEISDNENPEDTGNDIQANEQTETTAPQQPEQGGDNLQAVVNPAELGLNKVRDIDVSELTYDYLMKNFYTVVSSTTLNPQDIDSSKLMNIDMKLKTTNSEPQILIYHTHGQEGFADSESGNPATGIIGVGDYLTELLTQQYGYNVIHITDSFDLVNGVFDRSKAYDYSCDKVAKVLAENPTIEVVIDLHRDGVNENTRLVTEVNGKKTAQIMFFNGISRLNGVGEIGYLYNPYRTENLAMSMQMKVLAEEYFPGFTRRNYIQAYQYNLHMRPKSMLIEAGAQTNTFEEVKNAMEPLAALLHLCIGDATAQ